MEIIKDYLKSLNLTEPVINQLLKTFINNPDIVNEYENWLKTKEFVINNPITEQGYTAKMIYEKWVVEDSILDINGVFSLLVTLRENPENGLKYIIEGFPKK